MLSSINTSSLSSSSKINNSSSFFSSNSTNKIEHWKVNNEIFEIDSKYTIISYLGCGAYGIVCSASINFYYNHFYMTNPSNNSFLQQQTQGQGQQLGQQGQEAQKCQEDIKKHDQEEDQQSQYKTKQLIAIKKCKNIFDSRTMAKRTLREVRLLRHISHQNVSF